MSGWQLASRRKISAFRLGSVLWISAEGMKPTPCYDVDIQPSPADVFPPEFNLVWRTSGVCIRVLTPYRVGRAFEVGGGDFDTVRVRHRGGTDDVRIYTLPFPRVEGAEEDAAAGGEIAVGGRGVYTGYSTVSFEQAYFNAVSQVPYAYPDELIHVRVVEQGGLHGGFAGINQLFVSVRRSGPVPATRDREALAKRHDGEPEPCGEVAQYRAEQNLHDVIIHAEGEHRTTGWKVWFNMRPERIFPPQFEVLHEAPDGPSGDMITPFYIYTTFPSRQRIEEVVVHDAHGEHRVPVEWVPD